MFEAKPNQVFLIDLDGTCCNSSGEYKRWRDICTEISCSNFMEDRHPWCALGAKLSCSRSQEFEARGIFGNAAILKFPSIKGARRALQKISQGFYVSGREESRRGATLTWLEENEFPMLRLYLRRGHDIRSVLEIKRETYWVIREVYGKPGQEFLVVDDDERIKEVAESLGMLYLHPPECWA